MSALPPLDQAFLKLYGNMEGSCSACCGLDGTAPQPTNQQPADSAACDADGGSTASENPAPDTTSCGLEALRWPALVKRMLDWAPAGFERLADLLWQTAKEGQEIIAVTSRHRREGRTSLVLALARAVTARHNDGELLLVDADLARPALGSTLKVRARRGLCDVLDGTAATEEALCRVAGGRLTLLSAGSHEDRPPGGSPDKLRALFHALRSRYDLVLADAGPLWSFGKPPEILAVCDGALWVRSRDATSREELSAASAALSERGIAVLGVVENFVPRPGGRRAGAGRPHV